VRHELDKGPSATSTRRRVKIRQPADGEERPRATERGLACADAVRPLTHRDISAIVDLAGAVFPDNRWPTPAACEAYVRDLFLANPWRDDELPSWVSEDRSGLTGFCGVVPRRMSFRGREIRVAVSTSFMVHPRARGNLSALALAQKVINGPQDLTLTDGATPEACRLWRGIGGVVPPLYNLHWVQPLRPLRYALSVLGRRSRVVRAVSLGLRPLADLRAAVAGRGRSAEAEPEELLDRPLSTADMAARTSFIARRRELAPIYEADSLDWLLERMAGDDRKGPLRARAVLRRGELIGWYVYYACAGGVGEVVQIAAGDSAHASVWNRLLNDARRERVLALRGRLQPELIDALAASRSWLRVEGPHMLVHSRHAAISEAIERGSAFLTRLDGEWWIRVATG